MPAVCSCLFFCSEGDINVTATAEELEAALNLTLGSDMVVVGKTEDGVSASYVVVFHIADGKYISFANLAMSI